MLDEILCACQHLRVHHVPLDDPDRHHPENYWGLDQIGTDGQVRPGPQWRAA